MSHCPEFGLLILDTANLPRCVVGGFARVYEVACGFLCHDVFLKANFVVDREGAKRALLRHILAQLFKELKLMFVYQTPVLVS